jgi:hypothetical protein
MKKLILALAILATSIGFADAHPAKHHLSYDAWHATVAQKTASQPCFVQDMQMRANACEAHAQIGTDFSQFNDH